MRKRILVVALVLAFLILAVACNKAGKAEEKAVDYGPSIPAEKTAPVTWAGLRRSIYGIKPEPSLEEWDTYLTRMASEYEGSIPTFVWIVGTITGNGAVQRCAVNYPVGQKLENVDDFPLDENKAFLDLCDEKGYSVWLQVEPGDCDLVGLAKATMELYKDHKCVKGFGVDVEWYKTNNTNGYGSKITDELAQQLDETIKAVDPRFTLFLKHWDYRWMPPTYRSDIVFINDSQQFKSLEGMKSFFGEWADRYHPNPVMFQIGYEADYLVWKQFDNPKKELGEALAAEIPADQHVGIIWVDFTLKRAMKYGK